MLFILQILKYFLLLFLVVYFIEPKMADNIFTSNMIFAVLRINSKAILTKTHDKYITVNAIFECITNCNYFVYILLVFALFLLTNC